jgi:hypothetical protein
MIVPMISTPVRFAMNKETKPSPITFTSDYLDGEKDAATVVGKAFVQQAKQPQWLTALAALPNVRVAVHTFEQKIDVGEYKPVQTQVSIFLSNQQEPFAVLRPYKWKQGLTKADANTWLPKLQGFPTAVKTFWEKVAGDKFRGFMTQVCNIAKLAQFQSEKIARQQLETNNPVQYDSAVETASNASDIKKVVDRLVEKDLRVMLNSYPDQIKLRVLPIPDRTDAFILKAECTDDVAQNPEVGEQSASMILYVDDMSFERSVDTRRAFKENIEKPLSRMAFFGIRNLAPIAASTVYHSIQ